MFSGGQVTSTQVAQLIIPAIAQDFCPLPANQSEPVCQTWCPTVDQSTLACEIPDMADPYAELPAWSSLPDGLRTMISDSSHLGSLGYAATDAQAVYDAFKNKQTIPQPGASTTPAAPTQPPAQPTPPPPATTSTQPAQPAAAQQTQTPAESSVVHGHGICGSLFYDAGSAIFGLSGPDLGGVDFYGTGPDEYNGTMGARLGYCGVLQSGLMLGAELSFGAALAKTMKDVMGQEFQSGNIYYIDAKLRAGYLFDVGAVGIGLSAFALIGYAFSTEDVFVNGLIGPFGWSSVDVGGGAGLSLQVPLADHLAMNLGLDIGGRYTRQYIEGWRAGTENQVNATQLIVEPNLGLMYLW